MRTPLLIATVAVLASLSCLNNDFVWNSDELVKRPETRTLGAALSLFSPRVWAAYRGDSGENYHPVAALTFWADHVLWGTESWGCHLSNLLLHVAVCVLAAVVARQLTGSAGAALATGLLFAVHPAHIESVNWLKNRSQLTAVALAMSAISIALLPARPRWRAAGQCVAAAICFVAGLLAQEQAVGAAVIIAYVLWWVKPRRGLGQALCGTFVLALAALYVYLRFTVLQFEDKVGIPLDYLPEDTGFGTVSATLMFYVSKALLPIRHSVDYVSEFVSSGEIFSSFAALGAAAFAVVFGLRVGARTAVTAAVWFFAAVAPASNLIPILGRPLADQRTYFPSVGACLLVAGAYAGLGPAGGRGSRVKQRLTTTLLGLGLVSMAALTCQRNLTWLDADSLWRHGVRAAPRNERPRFNLALAYGEGGRRTLAKHELRQAMRIEPSPGSLVQLASLARDERDYEAAEQHLLAAIAMKREPNTHLCLALVYTQLKRYQDALEQTQMALGLDPQFFQAKIAAGDVYCKSGQAEQAVQTYLAAAAMDPSSPMPYLCIGDLERNRGNMHQAVNYYKKARELAPNHLPTLINEAGTYRLLHVQALKDQDANAAAIYAGRAFRIYARILQIDPRHTRALAGLGQLAEERGDRVAAARCYYEALGIDPHCQWAIEGLERLRGAP